MTTEQKVFNLIKDSKTGMTQSYISSVLHVSRVTVNKSIQRLKLYGCLVVKQKRSKGQYSMCFYRVKSAYNSKCLSVNKTLNNIINKRNTINKIKLLLLKTKTKTLNNTLTCLMSLLKKNIKQADLYIKSIVSMRINKINNKLRSPPAQVFT